MGVVNIMFPILPGKEEAARAWVAEIAGPRKEGWDAMQHRGDLTRETFTLLTTPMGSFMLVWVEGDIEKAMKDVATGQDEFTTWHRAQLKEITGVDLTQPSDASPPELLLDWSA
jgi:hypothetical protein